MREREGSETLKWGTARVHLVEMNGSIGLLKGMGREGGCWVVVVAEVGLFVLGLVWCSKVAKHIYSKPSLKSEFESINFFWTTP